MNKTPVIEQFILQDDGVFPNSPHPVLVYRDALDIPLFFPATRVKNVFEKHGWSNSWDDGILHTHHYHSVTHEVLGIYEGETILLLGGPRGTKIKVEKGDVLVIPAGVAHKNIGCSIDFKCIGAYPNGKDFDIQLGKSGERPRTDKNIKKVPVPKKDPIYGKDGFLLEFWDV